MPGTPEVLVIVVLVLLLFGPDKLPDLMRGVGKGMREVRKISSELRAQLDLSDEDDKPKH